MKNSYYITDEAYFMKFYAGVWRACECCHMPEGAGGEFGPTLRERRKTPDIYKRAVCLMPYRMPYHQLS
jgi:hypothetical protein